MPLQRAFSAN